MNLDEIDFYNIGSWPKALKAAVIVGAILIISLVFDWLFISSKAEELESLLTEEKRLKTFFINKHKMLVNISEYKSQMTEIQQRLSALVQSLPSANEIPNLVNQVSLAGKDSGLNFKEITILQEKKLKYYVELPIKIKVTGNYHQIGEFVSKVSALPRIITFHDLTLAPDKTKTPASPVMLKNGDSNEMLEFDVLAKTYRYLQHEAEEKSSGEGEKNGAGPGVEQQPVVPTEGLNKAAPEG